MNGKIDYDMVLQDLLEKKKEIENAISVISRIAGISGVVDSHQQLEEGVDGAINRITGYHGGNGEAILKDQIQREDIVECVKVEERNAGIDEDLIPVVGKKYRVIDIYKNQGKTTQYDVLDDSSQSKIRIPIMPQEVNLYKKREPRPPRVTIISTTVRCDKCGEQTALNLRSDTIPKRYEGDCINCGSHIKIEKKLLERK